MASAVSTKVVQQNPTCGTAERVGFGYVLTIVRGRTLFLHVYCYSSGQDTTPQHRRIQPRHTHQCAQSTCSMILLSKLYTTWLTNAACGFFSLRSVGVHGFKVVATPFKPLLTGHTLSDCFDVMFIFLTILNWPKIIVVIFYLAKIRPER